jgi:hypothetical protein
MPIQIYYFFVCGKHYRTPILTWLFAIIIFCSGSQSIAQNYQCDQQLTPSPDNFGYKLRKNRCESLYVSPISSQGGLELVSLTKGRLLYEYIGRSGKWHVPTTPGKINFEPLLGIFTIDDLSLLPGTSGAPVVSSIGIIGFKYQPNIILTEPDLTIKDEKQTNDR